ncbi:hypothetical protein [Rosenbergiella epipactidis]|uniref:hypothetical protein n=1 Tax=Rosenbergiella epipactidis TaxID=1544694 RepID=UPI001F4E1611|nr:hypothetical protein [Rosenbergiella epipactidis]
MSKAVRVFMVISLITFGVMYFYWPYLKMVFATSAYYTEKDKAEYVFYTPDLFKKMPRIAYNYTYEYGSVSGPEATVFTVRYHGVVDTTKIEEYLTSSGYRREPTCDVQADCWRSQKTSDIVTVIRYHDPDSVVLQIYRSPYN